MYDRVLFPTDGSDGAEVATDHALELAKRYDAPLHVVNVVDVRVAQGTDAYTGPALEMVQAQGETAVNDVVERAEAAGIEATTALLKGTPANAIVEESQDGDVIVMGTHGRTGIERFLIGSTTEKIVRAAAVPVVTVPVSLGGESVAES